MLNVNVNRLSNHPAPGDKWSRSFPYLAQIAIGKDFFRSIYVKMQMLVIDICLQTKQEKQRSWSSLMGKWKGTFDIRFSSLAHTFKL